MKKCAIFWFLCLVFLNTSSQAYSVYNLSSFPVIGEDKRHHFWNRYWRNGDIEPGQHSHCLSKHKECQDARLHLEIFEWETWKLGSWTKPNHEMCDIDVHNHEKVLVLGVGKGIICRVLMDPSNDEMKDLKAASREVRTYYKARKSEHLAVVHSWF